MKKTGSKIIGVFAAIAAVVVLASSIVVTYPNEYKLIKQFGEIVDVVEAPGVSFKIPFIQESASVPKELQIYDIPKSDVITKDKKSMIADAFVLWRISDPVLFTRHLNGQVAQAQSRISASVFSSMKSVISNMDQAEIIENRDGKLAQDISANISNALDGYGITVLAVETKSLDMPDDNKQAVYDRMISERNNIAASYSAQGNSSAQMIKNNTTKEVSVMKSEAKAEGEKIKAEGKPLTLTFDKKSWGTWNIGTWRYNGEALAGGGTDWEYVNMVGDVGGSLDWSGGNHGKETLVDIRFYDGATGEELLLSNGQSAEIRNLTIVERTELYTSDAKNPYANVTRTYRVAGNTITFEADCEFIRDVYMGRSYTCMFPISKQYGQFAEFYKLDGSVEKAQTTLEGVKPDYSGPYIGRTDAMRVVMYGPKNPNYKFDVRVYSLADASDFFSNGDKTFVWDMNSTHNKLYFSKFDTGAPTLMQAGQRTSNKSTWTFTVEE
mgnify:CR=1 FL=1